MDIYLPTTIALFSFILVWEGVYFFFVLARHRPRGPGVLCSERHVSFNFHLRPFSVSGSSAFILSLNPLSLSSSLIAALHGTRLSREHVLMATSSVQFASTCQEMEGVVGHKMAAILSFLGLTTTFVGLMVWD